MAITGEEEASGKLVQDVLMELGDGVRTDGKRILITAFSSSSSSSSSSSRQSHQGLQSNLTVKKNSDCVLKNGKTPYMWILYCDRTAIWLLLWPFKAQ